MSNIPGVGELQPPANGHDPRLFAPPDPSPDLPYVRAESEPDPAATEGGVFMRIAFGRDGDSAAFCRQGWADPELHHRWSVGPRSELVFPELPDNRNCAVMFAATPFGGPQRVVVSANGTWVADTRLEQTGTFGVVVPARIMVGGMGLRLLLDQPDARTGRDVLNVPDDRPLGFAITTVSIVDLDTPSSPASRSDRSAMLPVRELMLGFESLGDNCEFGIVQRRCGAEPLGLFRFAATRLEHLLVGIEHGFSDIAAPELLALKFSDAPAGKREYLLHQEKYGVIYHTDAFEGKVQFEKLLARECNRLSFLQSKLMEDLREGSKIFVIKSNAALSIDAVTPVWQALRRHGPNTLLWVVPAEPGQPAGTVRIRGEGLLQGYIDRFAPYENATAVSIECWIRLCRSALRTKLGQ